jgi:hypothetical protein
LPFPILELGSPIYREGKITLPLLTSSVADSLLMEFVVRRKKSNNKNLHKFTEKTNFNMRAHTLALCASNGFKPAT